MVGRAGSPLRAESAAPTGVVALPTIETPSFPTLRQRGLCGFTFYLGNPFSSCCEGNALQSRLISLSLALVSSNELCDQD